jgi:hypothetical protein
VTVMGAERPSKEISQRKGGGGVEIINKKVKYKQNKETNLGLQLIK